MADLPAASEQHLLPNPGSTKRRAAAFRGTSVKRTYDVALFCEADPSDFDTLVSPKTLVNTPRHARGRIKDALVQTHGIITARLASAERPYDTATEQGMVDEIGAMVVAIKRGAPEDVRCARLALAATLILLAERDDRPAPPAEGKRARSASRPPLDLGL